MPKPRRRTAAPILFAAIAASAIPTGAPAAVTQDGAATDEQRRFAARGFDRIDVAGCDEVRVVTGQRFDVAATGDARDLAALRIDTSGTTLRIRRAPNACSGRYRAVRVTVTMPEVRAVRIGGAGSIDLPALAPARFDAGISGSGSMRLAGLRGQEARVAVSGVGKVLLADIAVNRLTIDLSGAGSIRAEGAADTLSISSGGAGEVDTRALAAVIATVDASGTGEVRARARERATVRARGMARVSIAGGPTCAVTSTDLARATCG